MKHLLTGVAMAAALAIAAPAWAQNAPMTPPAGGNNPTTGAAGPFAPKAAPAPAKPAAAKPAAAKPTAMPMKPMAKKSMRHHHRMNEGDMMTEQLNQQELARLTGGGSMPMAPAGGPGGNNPTSGAAGPFAPK